MRDQMTTAYRGFQFELECLTEGFAVHSTWPTSPLHFTVTGSLAFPALDQAFDLVDTLLDGSARDASPLERAVPRDPATAAIPVAA